MGLKRKNKVKALFNMSSLTDIIFLLLIFFMLTSSIVAPNALNLKLPGKTQARVNTEKDVASVAVKRDGSYTFNGKRISPGGLEQELMKLARGASRDFTIAPDKQTPVEHVVFVMDIAMRMKLNAILLPEK